MLGRLCFFRKPSPLVRHATGCLRLRLLKVAPIDAMPLCSCLKCSTILCCCEHGSTSPNTRQNSKLRVFHWDRNNLSKPVLRQLDSVYHSHGRLGLPGQARGGSHVEWPPLSPSHRRSTIPVRCCKSQRCLPFNGWHGCIPVWLCGAMRLCRGQLQAVDLHQQTCSARLRDQNCPCARIWQRVWLQKCCDRWWRGRAAVVHPGNASRRHVQAGRARCLVNEIKSS